MCKNKIAEFGFSMRKLLVPTFLKKGWITAVNAVPGIRSGALLAAASQSVCQRNVPRVPQQHHNLHNIGNSSSAKGCNSGDTALVPPCKPFLRANPQGQREP